MVFLARTNTNNSRDVLKLDDEGAQKKKQDSPARDSHPPPSHASLDRILHSGTLRCDTVATHHRVGCIDSSPSTRIAIGSSHLSRPKPRIWTDPARQRHGEGDCIRDSALHLSSCEGLDSTVDKPAPVPFSLSRISHTPIARQMEDF